MLFQFEACKINKYSSGILLILHYLGARYLCTDIGTSHSCPGINAYGLHVLAQSQKTEDLNQMAQAQTGRRQGLCHGQTTVSDRVRGSRGSGISDKITKMDFEEGLFPKGKSVT